MEYVSLDEDDFRCLVSGGIIKCGQHIQICLQDIGYSIMYDAIADAQSGLIELHTERFKD